MKKSRFLHTTAFVSQEKTGLFSVRKQTKRANNEFQNKAAILSCSPFPLLRYSDAKVVDLNELKRKTGQNPLLLTLFSKKIKKMWSKPQGRHETLSFENAILQTRCIERKRNNLLWKERRKTISLLSTLVDGGRG